MKLGTCTPIFECFGDDRYKKMKEYGFDYADYSLSGELEGRTEEEYRDIALREKALADEAGVVIWQTHGPWRYPPHDETPEHRAERMETMKRSIRLTAMIGCKNWVIHPLMPFGPSDDFVLDEFLRINKEFFTELLAYAKALDVTICFENMPMRGLTISSPEKTLEFIRDMNDDHFKFCLDTGHCTVIGKDPVAAVRMAGSDLRVMHVHDNHGTYNDEHLVPYMGIIDWKEYYKALVEIGFDGVFSLELWWNGFIDKASDETRIKALKLVVDDIMND